MSVDGQDDIFLFWSVMYRYLYDEEDVSSNEGRM